MSKKNSLESFPGVSSDELHELRETFDMFDKKKTGFIDGKELKDTVGKLGFDPNNKMMNHLISAMREEKMDFPTFIRMMTDHATNRTEANIKKVFDMYDVDSTGSITVDNLRDIARQLGETKSSTDFENMISLVDVNDQGKVTFADFLNFLTRERPNREFIADAVIEVGKPVTMKKGQKAALPSNVNDCFVGLGWECKRGVDLDVSCVMLKPSSHGRHMDVHDIVWHNDTQAPGVTHSGDNKTGMAMEGDCERINFQLNKVEPEVTSLAIAVCIFTENSDFGDVSNAYIRLVDSKTNQTLARYTIKQGDDNTAVYYCKFTKGPGGWQFMVVDTPCYGRVVTQSECLDTLRGKQLRKVLELSPWQEVPLSDEFQQITIEDHWGCIGEWVWLDATILPMTSDVKFDSKYLDFEDKSLYSGGMVHSGDQGDEAQTHGKHIINIEFAKIPNKVKRLVFTVCVYTKTLTQIDKPFITVKDNDDSEICRFSPKGGTIPGGWTSIVMCDFTRITKNSANNGWAITGRGVFGHGRSSNYQPMEATIRKLLKKNFDRTPGRDGGLYNRMGSEAASPVKSPSKGLAGKSPKKKSGLSY